MVGDAKTDAMTGHSYLCHLGLLRKLLVLWRNRLLSFLQVGCRGPSIATSQRLAYSVDAPSTLQAVPDL